MKALITTRKENWARVKYFASMNELPVGIAADYLLERALGREDIDVNTNKEKSKIRLRGTRWSNIKRNTATDELTRPMSEASTSKRPVKSHD